MAGLIVKSPYLKCGGGSSVSGYLRYIGTRERVEILDAIAEAGGNLTEVARRLGIARSTLYVKLEEHGIERPRRH